LFYENTSTNLFSTFFYSFSSLEAQSDSKTDLAFFVYDLDQNKSIKNASISILQHNIDLKRLKMDKDGQLKCALFKGKYTFKVTKNGYQDYLKAVHIKKRRIFL